MKIGSSNDQHKYFIYAGSLGAMDDVMSILKGVKLLIAVMLIIIQL
jgi:hypothetical protein